jgi:hypothetical protein
MSQSQSASLRTKVFFQNITGVIHLPIFFMGGKNKMLKKKKKSQQIHGQSK